MAGAAHAGRSVELPTLVVAPATETRYVGVSEPKVDAVKLAQGKPAFTADVEMRGMLIGKILHSPIAHGCIKRIDASTGARAARRARGADLPGHAARVVYSTAGQSDPIPGPLDFFSLDRKVRFVGDRVAAVAAETEEIAAACAGVDRGRVRGAARDSRSRAKHDAGRAGHPRRARLRAVRRVRSASATWRRRIHIELGDVDEALARPPTTSSRASTRCPRCSRRPSSRTSASPTGTKTTAW